MGRDFVKMNGLGNDFVIVETHDVPFDPTPEVVRALADRKSGIGFDQLIAIDPPKSAQADAGIRFWNSAGDSVEACGNGTRCAAWLIMDRAGTDAVRMASPVGPLLARRAGDQRVEVDMGCPRLDWQDIPLAEAMDTRGIELQVGPIDAPLLHTAGAVSMGNPHVVFFIGTPASDDLVRGSGSLIEHHPLFPQGVNVGFAHISGPEHIRLRVWERGAGLTRACGTGACAALVAANRRGLVGRRARLQLDGGDLDIHWRKADDHVIMSGPIAFEFSGTLP